jgi:hypothetical protein
MTQASLWERAAVEAVAVGAWFWTQSLIGRRAAPSGRIGDSLHEWSASLNAMLHRHPAWADHLLVASSALIDLMGIFLLGSAIFGPTVRPLVGLLLLFALRQACQALCSLPTPEGMIWRHPGFPSLLVTYGVSTDLFFSGHTAIAVLGASELARVGPLWLGLLGGGVAVFEAATVLVLRAHYTMDVFTGLVTALYVATLAGALAPSFDGALKSLLSL